MKRFIQTLIRLSQLCAFWLLVRFTQALLEAAGLNWEACDVSNAELHLQVKIQRLLHPIKA